MRSAKRRNILLSILFLLASLPVFAGNDPEYRQTLFGRNGELQPGISQVTTTDLNFQTYKNVPGAIEQTYYVKNAVRLMIDEESEAYPQSDFNVDVVVSISTTNATGTLTVLPQQTLSLSFKKGQGQISGAISSYEFKDGVIVDAKIETITSNVSWDVRPNLKLVNEIISLRDWGFSCSVNINSLYTLGSTADEWHVKWDVPLNFQTEYDLEWAYIEESAVNDYMDGGSLVLEKVFENNATRITTSKTDYYIPSLYEGDGRLYARVRMAQIKVSGQRIEGAWFYLSHNGQNYHALTTGFEDKLNWQATTTYAEEGKRKTVLQVYDGTLRGRQTVTKDNVNGNTIVAESFYDYQGRAVIQVLPAPTINTIIGFTKNFNQFDDAHNAKTVYDKLDVGQSACNKLTAPMLNTAANSAAQYYSNQNPDVNDGFHKYIPNANGYPYTETRYTNDGTGRIDAQGGVGPLFQINGNRETKYYYESVDQDDLDALFGTSAGYASHYSKNWVRDANGQYSVSYVDMKGKTIATALAGDSSGNLRALPSYAAGSKNITRQLIDPETNNVHGNSIISSKSLMVPKQGSYTFNYSLTPEKLKMMLCTDNGNVEFCFDCLYELNISIIPDCSDKVIPGFNNPVVKRNFNLGEYLTSCVGNNSPLLTENFTVILPEGSYTIVKELKLSTESRDWYRENVYLTNDTCKKKIDFIMQQYNLALQQQNCYVTCAQCTTKLGTQTDFINRIVAEAGLTPAEVTAMMPQLVAAYEEAKANCDRICENGSDESTDELASIKSMMLLDMTPPFGQYARFEENNIPLWNQKFNIFNQNHPVNLCNPQSAIRPPYKFPVNYTPATGTTTCATGTDGYKNIYGGVTLTQSAAATMTEEAFTDNFNDNYAQSLLYYHPEFNKLKLAETNLLNSYRFGSKLQNTESLSNAVTRNFINPSLTNEGAAADHLLQQDPFFVLTGFNSPYYNTMRSAILNNFIPGNFNCPGSVSMGMWKVAQLSVYCLKELRANSTQPANGGCFVPTAAFTNCVAGLNNLPPNTNDGHCTADHDMVWKNFRGFYTTLRNKLVSEYLTTNTTIDYSIFNTNNGLNYQERFVRLNVSPPPGIEDLDNLLNNTPGGYQQLAAQEAENTCKANTENWMMRLRRCNLVDNLANTNPVQWASDSQWLSKYLVKICTPGVDYMGHPFGASSLPDGKPAVEITENPNNVAITPLILVRNFPALIEYYLKFRFGPNAIDAYCYPELIDYPKAYNVAPPTVNVPIVTVPEPCNCERINYFKTKWQNTGSVGTFSSYLQNYHGTTIAQNTLDELVAMCNTGYTSTNPNCNFLTTPLKLPAIFQCRGTANPDSSKTCINCADFKDIVLAFKAERGVNNVPIANPQNDADIALNRAFADYANYKTGFSKTWPEYVEFSLLCVNNTDLSCKTLQSLLQQFYATNPPQTGTACENAFVTFMNNATGLTYTFSQWMQEFIKACGAAPPVCQPVVTCTTLKSLIDSYYTTYGFQVWRNANCQTLFTNFVNNALQTTYTYEQIVNLYNFVCGSGCTLSPCSFPNPHLLTLLYNTYKVQFPNPPKSVTLCQQNFTDWFNNQLGFDITTPYTWLQIVALYNAYSIDCTPDLTQLCTPPYSCESLNYVIQKFYAAYPNADQLVNCIQLFKDFFNNYFGTSYTYQEIAEIYAAVCNTTLVVCQGSTGWDCKQLIAITQTYSCNIDVDACSCFTIYFNNLFGTSYTYSQIVEIYRVNCGYALNMCPSEPPVFTCEQIQNTLNKFRKLYPNGGNYGATCEAFFTAFFNGEHGTYLNYTEIVNQYLVVCEMVLDVCNSQCTSYTGFVNTHINRYGTIKIPLEARRQLFAFMFNEAYGYNNKLAARGSATGNQPLVYTQVKDLLAGCMFMPVSLETETQSFSLSDPDVLKDLRTAYYLVHPNGIPANCENDFTNWVNTIMGTDLDYTDLEGYYNTYIGPGSGNICGTPASGVSGAGSATTSNLEGRYTAVTLPPMLCGLNVEIFDNPPVDTSTCKDPWLLAISDATIKWELYIDSLRRNFDVAWYKKCTNAKNLESFTVSFEKAEYHYTLYDYDQAGQLVRTIPPQGVDDRRADAAFLADVKAKRLNVKNGALEQDNIRIPDHTLATDYRYNTLGQVVQQKTPDGGLSKFFYDILGRLAVSQNAQQALDGKYSYTLYDFLGRITEVGQKPQGSTLTQSLSRDPVYLNNWINGAANKEQITRTVYDVSYFNGDDILKPELLYQRNLRNRVSYTQVFDNQPGTFIGTHRTATYYTYDIHGNVDTLLQDYGDNAYYANVMNNNSNRYKKMAYNYDLISGKVNMVTYQPGYYNPQTQSWVRRADQFYHRYVYDAENKLTDVYTSHDSLVWERDAKYLYYKHGPLARMELGQQVVQGVDYAYTLQGWMKGVNSTAITPDAPETCADGTAKDILDVYTRMQFGQPSIYTARQEVNFHPDFDHDPGDEYETIINASLQPCVPVITPTPFEGGDMGTDGSSIANANRFVPRDAYGFSLNYYKATHNSATVYDYQAINGSMPFNNNQVFSLNNADGNNVAKPLFNGNIASMMVNIPKLGNPQLYGYEYDQLNRLVSMDAFAGFNNGSNDWNGGIPTPSQNYKERVSYDANGNILSYFRNGSTAFGGNQNMDNLTYQYPKDPNGKILNNRLRYVQDNVADGAYNEDINSQTTLNQAQVLAERLPEQANDNYRYDAIGNLTKDAKEGITNITWTVYGKIASVTKNGKTITYTYDASGNRISKTVPNDFPVATNNTTWYVRDATGNVMSVYEQRTDLNSYQLTQSEVHLYGSSRLGIMNVNRNVQTVAGGNLVNFERGKKMYELSNHLGNVLATVTDRKLAVDDGTYDITCPMCPPPPLTCPPCYYYQQNSTPDGIADYYVADVVTANDYYPFGMGMVGRKFNSGTYRYGFNGKERDKDMNSITAYDYGFRIYNPGIARFLSVDPLSQNFPSLTTYQFASNTPIQALDLDGREGVQYLERVVENGVPIVRRVVEVDVHVAVSNDKKSVHFYSDGSARANQRVQTEVLGDLRSQFRDNRFRDADGNNVIFRFNVSTFQVDEAGSIETQRSLLIGQRGQNDRGQFTYRGVIVQKQHLSDQIIPDEEQDLPITENGNFERGVVVTVNDQYYSPKDQKSHTLGHELLHFFLRLHPNRAVRDPENTPEGHQAAGGGLLNYGRAEFRYPPQLRTTESDKKTQVTIFGLNPLNQTNVTNLLESVPMRPEPAQPAQPAPQQPAQQQPNQNPAPGGG